MGCEGGSHGYSSKLRSTLQLPWPLWKGGRRGQPLSDLYIDAGLTQKEGAGQPQDQTGGAGRPLG